jgi:hypothetical protein
MALPRVLVGDLRSVKARSHRCGFFFGLLPLRRELGCRLNVLFE